MAALMMTSAGYAQDAEDPPVDDGEVIWIDDGEMYMIDPICVDCSGEVVLDDEIVLWPTDEVIEVTGEEGEDIHIYPSFECPIDPICIECSGEVIPGEGEEVLWPTDEVIEVTGVEGEEIYIHPMPYECPTEGCDIRDLGIPEWNDNPEIYYNMSGGDAVGVDEESVVASKGSRSVVTQRGPDLCESPAQELVWLCDIVNGNDLSE